MASVVDGLPFTDEKKDYIVKVLDPILEEMVSDVLTEVPPSPLDVMIAWLRKRSGLSSVHDQQSLQARNKALKQELKQIKSSIEEAGHAIKSEDKEDECDDLPESMKKPEAKDFEVIIMAMKEVPMTAGEKVINEGDDGDFLFVIETGSLECIKKIDGEDKVVKTCEPGDVFGELALLYNCPRAASVVAKGDCVCWQLDRESFNHIVKEAAATKRNKYENFLKSVSLIASIDAYERSQIADALVPETFKKGDTIVRQDEPGDKFYIVEEGTFYATKGSERVMEYKSSDYFGELALLKNQPRAASVIVESEEAKVLSMSRMSFSKMLGPLQSLLTRQADKYT